MRHSVNDLNNIIQSYPCKVSFVGFESDTYRLQSAGWQISARQEMYFDSAYPRLTLAIHHPEANLYALTSPIYLPYDITYSGATLSIFLQNIVFSVSRVNSTYRVFEPIQESIKSFNEFEAIDARPRYVNSQDVRLADFKIFKPVGNPKEIIVGPQTIQEALDYVLKLQDPEQIDIRERKRMELKREESQAILTGDSNEQVMAQIICIR